MPSCEVWFLHSKYILLLFISFFPNNYNNNYNINYALTSKWIHLALTKSIQPPLIYWWPPQRENDQAQIWSKNRARLSAQQLPSESITTKNERQRKGYICVNTYISIYIVFMRQYILYYLTICLNNWPLYNLEAIGTFIRYNLI